MKFDRTKYASNVFTHPKFGEKLIKNLGFDMEEVMKLDKQNTKELAQRHLMLSSELALARRTRDYLLTDSALAVIERVSVTRRFDLSLLQNPDGKTRLYTFWVDEFMGYRVLWTQNEIVTIGVMRQAFGGLGHDYHSISHYVHLHTPKVMALCDEGEFEIMKWTIQTLLFLELTDPQFLFLPPNKKFAARPMGYTNSLPTGLTIVTSKWNFHVVRTDAFGVKGHYRAQRVGVGRREIKMTWIQPHQRKGYVRRAKT